MARRREAMVLFSYMFLAVLFFVLIFVIYLLVLDKRTGRQTDLRGAERSDFELQAPPVRLVAVMN